MSRTLCHYTITTGHARQSPRTEVGDHVIAALRPLLATGEHSLPGPPGYRVRVTVDGSTLAATVVAPSGAPIVTTIVCVDAAGLAAALRATGCVPAVPLTLPCALDDVHESAALDPGALSWTGDFARCIAWAWAELREGVS